MVRRTAPKELLKSFDGRFLCFRRGVGVLLLSRRRVKEAPMSPGSTSRRRRRCGAVVARRRRTCIPPPITVSTRCRRVRGDRRYVARSVYGRRGLPDAHKQNEFIPLGAGPYRGRVRRDDGSRDA